MNKGVAISFLHEKLNTSYTILNTDEVFLPESLEASSVFFLQTLIMCSELRV